MRQLIVQIFVLVAAMTLVQPSHRIALGIRYATAQGVGIRSALEEVRAAFGAPDQRRARGPVEDWIYWSLGFEVSVAGTGPQAGRIVSVSVFAPR